LFRTAKYRPEFPTKGFAELDTAREWAARFVHWYNNVHRHSGIKYVTPAQRHAGHDRPVLTARHELYQRARQSNPRRWSGQTRDWTPIAAVTLNPERDIVIRAAATQTQLSGSARAPALPSRPDNASAMARNAGEERSTAARSHAQRPLRREHGEDGAHRNFPEASTMAHSGSARGPGHRRASGQTGGAG
jgi:putative transposase